MQSTGYYAAVQPPQANPYMIQHQINPLSNRQQMPSQQDLLSQQLVMESNEDSLPEDEEDEAIKKPMKRSGRRKIKIEYIQDKTRRHITFSKRKAGIMKKAYELSTLTGTQVLLLVVSETGLVYTFTTPKLQPLVTKPEGKNIIQSCLNAPDSNLVENDSNPASMLSSSPPMGR